MNTSTEHILQCNQSEPPADASGRIVDLMNENASALTFTCGHDDLTSFSCVLLKFVLHVANNMFSDKFNNGGRLMSTVLLYFYPLPHGGRQILVMPASVLCHSFFVTKTRKH